MANQYYINYCAAELLVKIKDLVNFELWLNQLSLAAFLSASSLSKKDQN